MAMVLNGAAAINGVGNELANALYGNSAANSLDGGAGNDYLLGGLGNDIYSFGRGDGVDTLIDDDAAAGNSDVLRLDADVGHDQLWFAQNGNNLEVSVLGGAGTVVVKDWYLGSAHHIERIEAGNGKVLLEGQVQNLVAAMSSFAPPAAGQFTLPSAYQASLSPVLAANWQ